MNRKPRTRLTCVLTLLLLAASAYGQEHTSATGRRSWKKKWIVSALVLAAATAFDAHSSVGRLEANPLLRSRNGQFSPARGVAIKAAIAGSTLLVESFAARQTPEVYKAAALTNFASAGVFTAVAVRNRGVSRE